VSGTRYAADRAVEIATHDEPALSQRSHWYVYDIGVRPDHVPWDAANVWPLRADPETTGDEVFDG
jgi:hypothetical protein